MAIPLERVRRRAALAVRTAGWATFAVAVAAVLLPLPIEQRVLYTSSAVALLALAVVGLASLQLSSPAEHKEEPR